MKRRFKAFGGAAGGWLLLRLVALRLRLSEPATDRLAAAVAGATCRLLPSRRRVAERNLRRAMGAALGDRERGALVRAVYGQAVRGFADLLLLFRRDPSPLTDRITVSGLEHLERAAAAGRGVIAVSAHYGPFPALGLCLRGAGGPFHFLYRRPKDRRTARLFDDWLARARTTVVDDAPRHLAGVRCLRALAGGGVVAILIDQHFPAGVSIPFFGVPSKTGIGAVLLAHRSRAPLVPMVVRRGADGSIRLVIEPAFPPPVSRSREALTGLMERLTARVEAWIRQDPTQWFWVHRRWKDLDRAEDASGADRS